MNRWLHTLADRLRAARRPKAAPRRPRSVRPSVLALEDRLVPATLSAPTDMTELARLFPRHTGPTTLYLNFDGWRHAHPAQPEITGIAPFMAVSGDRDKDIQDTLFRTAEIFSPFDVRVVRRFGDGDRATDGGATTIFIGADGKNATEPFNRARWFVPDDDLDFPGNVKGVFHRPNGDSFDTAFVDPVAYSPAEGHVKSDSIDEISRSIAEAAGVTFGLGHVLNAPGESLPDLMNFDTDVPNVRFMDRTLNITGGNFLVTGGTNPDDMIPRWHIDLGSFVFPYRMRTQNSFTYLQAVLGARPVDDFANVAHGESVDHFADTAPAVGRGSVVTGAIQRAGDYDVFRLTPAATQTLDVSALRVPGGVNVNPVLLVYEGQSLVAFNNDRSAADFSSQLTYTFLAGHTYRIVVGAADGGTAGQYRLSVSGPGDPNPDHTGPRVIDTRVNYNPKTGFPTSILVTFDEDVDPATFSGADVALVGADGRVRHPSTVSPTGILSSRQFLIFVGNFSGEFTLRIGPDVSDFAGNRMNQDGDAVNGEAGDDVYAALVDLSPLGFDDPTGPARKASPGL